jgi:hypothetical protein
MLKPLASFGANGGFAFRDHSTYFLPGPRQDLQATFDSVKAVLLRLIRNAREDEAKYLFGSIACPRLGHAARQCLSPARYRKDLAHDDFVQSLALVDVAVLHVCPRGEVDVHHRALVARRRRCFVSETVALIEI